MNIATLPKVELHCHLDGIFHPAMVAAIRQADPAYPLHPKDFQDRLPIHDYASFWNWHGVLAPLRQHRSLKNFYTAFQYHVTQLKAQNVRYFEVMIGASDTLLDEGQAQEELQAFRAWVDELEDGEIQIEFLIACGRHHSAEKIYARAEKVIDLYESGLICGMVMAGAEPNNPIQPHTAAFARLHAAGVGIEIHAGEWLGAESVWDALKYGYPDRIGHGVTLFQDPKLIELFQEQQIHIEMCPTSNLKTGSLQRLEDHPIRQALELGLNFSINTDDPGTFECSLNSEYETLATTFGFTEADFEQIYQNSLKARFQKTLRV